MNNDAYKLKYLKYKERYLELKEISGGAMAGVGGDKSVEAARRQLRFLRELTTKIDDALSRNIRYTDSRGNSKLVKQYVMKTRDRVNFLPEDLNIAVNKIFDDLKDRMVWHGGVGYKVQDIEFDRTSNKGGIVSEDIYVSRNTYKDFNGDDRKISLKILSGGQGIGLASYEVYAMRPEDPKRRQLITKAM